MNQTAQISDLKANNYSSCNDRKGEISKMKSSKYYLKKPFNKVQVINVLKKAFKTIELLEKLKNISEKKVENLYDKYPLNILVAEDNLINQKVLMKLLEFCGFNADVVFDGEKAVEACASKHYDIIFMDIEMPEMDGYTATTCILHNSKEEVKPIIIAFTANASKEKCLKTGMLDFLCKPVKIEQIERCINYWGEKITQNCLKVV